MCAAQPGGRGRGREPRADVGRDCSELNLDSSPHIDRVFTASGTCSSCGWNTRGSQRHGLAYVEAHPRPQCRARAKRFGQRLLRFACSDRIGCSQWHGSAAACSRLQHVLSAAGSFTGGTRLQHSGCGCNTLCCAAAPRLCCAQAGVPEGSTGGADVGRGMESVGGAEASGGKTLSRCRGGQGIDSVPVQIRVGV